VCDLFVIVSGCLFSVISDLFDSVHGRPFMLCLTFLVTVSGCLFCVVADLFGSVRGCLFVLYLTCSIVFMVVLLSCV